MTDRSAASAPGPRYEPLVKIASGGMATVFVGALRGPFGFEQLVAIKRLHEHLLEDPSFREALIAEARIAARIHHANVVDVRDIEVVGETIQIVMDYVEGASLFQLIVGARKASRKVPPGIAARIVLDACAGLHAAHELQGEDGAKIGLVHRDISPQNILVGVDGLARVTDFGVAKEAMSSLPSTTQGILKGKVGYMAPEYLRGARPDRRIDVFALGIVLWEAVTQRRLFRGAHEGETLERLLNEEAPRISEAAPDVGAALDEVATKALTKDPGQRFETAEEMATALEAAARGAGLLASHAEVARFVVDIVGEELSRRRELVREKRASKRESQPAAAPRSAVEAPGEVVDTVTAPTAVSVSVPGDDALTRVVERRPVASQNEAPARPRRAPLAVIGVAVVLVAALGVFASRSLWRSPEPQPASDVASLAPGSSVESVSAAAPAPAPVPVSAPASASASAPAPAPVSASASASASASVSATSRPAPPSSPKPKPAPALTSRPNTKSLPPNPYAK